MIYRIAVLAGIMVIICWLIRIISDMADIDMDIRYIKNWVSTQSVTTNAADIAIAIDKAKSDLMVEMACIGAKNNADIQRVKDGFQVGDVIELSGVLYFITKRITRVGSNGSLAGYMVVRNDGTSEYREIEDIGVAKFIKHIDGFDDAFSRMEDDIA